LENFDCDATVACAKLRVETDFGVNATKQGHGQTNCIAGEDINTATTICNQSQVTRCHPNGSNVETANQYCRTTTTTTAAAANQMQYQINRNQTRIARKLRG